MVTKRLLLSILVVFALGTLSPASAVSHATKWGTPFYDDTPDVSGTSGGTCTGLTTPTINDAAALAVAFNTFEQHYTHGTSPLVGHFGEMISGAVAAGYNPMIVLSQALHETTLGTAHNTGDTVFNAWGRAASASQPAAVSPNGRRWYKWTSWTDALTGTDNISAYDKRQWIDNYHYTTIDQMLMTYAPPSDGNDTPGYIKGVYANIAEIVGYAGSALSCSGAPGTVNGVVAGNIVQTAIGLAWPNNHHQPQSEATAAYLAVWNPNHVGGRVVTDCGMFVSTVMRVSGVDPAFPGINQDANTTTMEHYILAHPEKYTAWHPKSTSELQPGDIMIFEAGDATESTGHTLIWIGKQSNGLAVAEASGTTRAPMLNIAGNATWMISATGGAVYAARMK